MARHPVDLALLTVEELSDLRDATDGLLGRVVKVSARRIALAVERKMGAGITQAWKAAASSGLRTGMAKLVTKPYTPSAIEAFLHAIGLSLADPLTTQQQSMVEGNLRSIYRISKQDAVTAAKGTFVFGEADQLAIAASGNQQQFWIGGFYNDQLSTRVSAVSRDVLLEQGLSHREAGPVLNKALQQEFGLVPGALRSGFAPEVPARYAGNPDYYFQQVSSVAGHQSRIFGKMTGYQDAGVRRVQLINPMDERTGEVCFAPGTPVLLADGTQAPIDSILPGTRIITGTGLLRPVKAVSRRLAHEWVTLTSFGGRLTVTPSHEIMSRAGWKPAERVTDADQVRVHQLRGSFYGAAEQGREQSMPILLSDVLPGVPPQDVLGGDSVRALRQDLRDAAVRAGGGEASALLPGMQETGREEGLADEGADLQVQEVWQALSAEAHRSPVREASALLLPCLPRSVGGEGLPDLRGGVHRDQQEVLLQGLLPTEQCSHSPGDGGEGGAARPSVRLRGGSSSGAWRGGLLGAGESGAGGGRGVLAPPPEGEPAQAGRDHEGGVDSSSSGRGGACRPSEGRCESGSDLSPCWDQGSEDRAESGVAQGWARLRVGPRFHLIAPAYNLEIEGDDPTYVAAGVVVHNCRQLNGQVFTVNAGMARMASIIGAGTPDEVKLEAPWPEPDAVSDELAGTRPGSRDATSAIEGMGTLLPPFHPLCRTEVIILD